VFFSVVSQQTYQANLITVHYTIFCLAMLFKLLSDFSKTFFSLRMMPIQLFSLLVFLLPGFLEGARILALFPIPSQSHYYHALPYLERLATLGHEITSITPFPSKEPRNNLHEISVPEVFHSFDGKEDVCCKIQYIL